MPITEIVDDAGNAMSADDALPIDEPKVDDPPADDVVEDVSEETADDGEDAGLTVTIGDQQPDEESDVKGAPSWVKEVRENARRTAAENKELRRQLDALQPVDQAPVLPPKPTMESVAWDTAKFSEEMDKWYAAKVEVDKHNAKQEEARKAQQDKWQQTLDSYAAEKEKLRADARDLDDAEATVQNALSRTQQAILVKGKQSALVMLALGRNTTKLKELAAIQDPVDFAIAIGEIGAQIKVNKKSSLPPPHEGVKGVKVSASGATGARSAREAQLIAQAMKTGDVTALSQYRRQQKQARK